MPILSLKATLGLILGIAALKELLAEDAEKAPVVIWCRFQEDCRIINRHFLKDSIQFHAGIPDEERESNLKDWLGKDGPRLLLATPGSAGTGRNLQGRCQHAIYYSNSENSIQRWQSEDRIHRIGTVGEFTTFTDLIARASRDMKILANLKAKKDLSDLTLNDHLN